MRRAAAALAIVLALTGCGTVSQPGPLRSSTPLAPSQPMSSRPVPSQTAPSQPAPSRPAPSQPTASAATPTGQTPSTTPSTPSGQCRRVVVAAGDIVNDVDIADRTGRLAEKQSPDAVLVLGDNQYPSGSLRDYRREYDRTAWGDLKALTRPIPGNHEYRTPGAAGYYTYFDDPAPYYAWDAGCGWRAYALNSEIDLTSQITWLRADLADHPEASVVAYWHRPRWSSGTEHGDDPAMQPFWTGLAGRHGVVLNGHEHNYERFAPVGRLRQFVAGTGGRSTYSFGPPANGSQRRIAETSGVLRLDLRPDGYRWTFLDTSGTALDSGTG